MYLKPAQQAGDSKDPEQRARRFSQGKGTAPAADLRAMPDKHAEAGAVKESQAGQVSDGARPPLAPDVTKVSLRGASA
jgi:hypothetical protein